MASYGTNFDGTANTRANQEIRAHSVPDVPKGSGPDCGGAANLRADAHSPATSIPASGPSSVGNKIPGARFNDRSI